MQSDNFAHGSVTITKHSLTMTGQVVEGGATQLHIAANSHLGHTQISQNRSCGKIQQGYATMIHYTCINPFYTISVFYRVYLIVCAF